MGEGDDVLVFTCSCEMQVVDGGVFLINGGGFRERWRNCSLNQFPR